MEFGVAEVKAFIKALVALFVVMDPIGTVPLFLGITKGFTPQERRQVARIAGMAVILVLIISEFAGEALLSFFGITVPSFRIAGGILILLMALDMLNARPSRSKTTPEERAEASQKHEVAIVPIAIPFMSGPGAISAVVIQANKAESMLDKVTLAIIIVLAGLSAWLILALAGNIEKVLGRTGINILSRLFGLILAAVAIEYIAGGLKEIFPSWNPLPP